jgi:hypothetical protein
MMETLREIWRWCRRTMALAALDLDHLLDQLPIAAVEPGLDRSALAFEAEAGLLLLGCRDP